ncbi:hypothetical protein M426DRAFT_131976 [Hypoxylon sp. CI-4A]|nr:hypothetical protein M426DRAFT_131976 [Hypoxylon sp. CI-4A]
MKCFPFSLGHLPDGLLKEKKKKKNYTLLTCGYHGKGEEKQGAWSMERVDTIFIHYGKGFILTMSMGISMIMAVRLFRLI